MNILYDKEIFNIPTYKGDDEDETESFEKKNNKKVFCSNKTSGMTPISIRKNVHLSPSESLSEINENIIMFILPYKRGNEMLYTVYCYTFNDLKKFIYSSQPLFKYNPGSNIYTKMGTDESFPILKLMNESDAGGIHIRVNYFLLLRYTTFILFNPQEMSIGSSYGGLGNIHGSIETVYDTRPTNKSQFLTSETIDYFSLTSKIVDFQKEDFTPGNFPPYKVEMIYEDTLIRERERKSCNIVIENVFFNSGDFFMCLFNKNENSSTRFFSSVIKYNIVSGGYKPERNFLYTYNNLTIEDVTVEIKKGRTVYDILVTRGESKVIHEYLSPWTEDQYEYEEEYKSIKEGESKIYENPLLDLIHTIGEGWNMTYISANPNITQKDVEDNNENWDQEGLHRNPNIGDYNVGDNKWNLNYLIKQGGYLTIQKLLSEIKSNNIVDWKKVSANPGISLKNILDNPRLPWDWKYISMNPSITIEDVKNNHRRPWVWSELGNNNLNVNILKKLTSVFLGRSWDWNELTINPNIDLDFIKSKPNYPWVKNFLYLNPTIPFKVLIENDMILEIDDDGFGESYNISLKDITENKNIGWDWYNGISYNPNVTEEFINDNKGEKFDIKALSANPNISIEFIKDYIGSSDEESLYKALSRNPNITIDYLIQNKSDSWDWSELSRNRGITFEDITNNNSPDFKWEYEFVAQNPNVYNKDILKNEDKFEWKYLSLNPNLDLTIIYSNSFEIRFDNLSGNRFNKYTSELLRYA